MIRTAYAVALACAALLTAGAPIAPAAAGECPNEAIRIQQGSTHLPECRAWELVSMADKGRSQAERPTPISSDGSRILYTIGGPSPGSVTGSASPVVADRTANGWKSRHVLSPSDQVPGNARLTSFATSDLSAVALSTFDGIGNADASPDISLVTKEIGGGLVPRHTFPVNFGASGLGLTGSDDLSHIYVNVEENGDPFLPDMVPGASLVYDFGGAVPELVSRMPGTNLPPACGTPKFSFSFAVGGETIQSEHWTSTDGRRVFFATRGDNCGDPIQLYMRDVEAGVTTLISGPPTGAAPDNGVERFLQATPDGARVFYRSSTSYDPRDGEVDANDEDADVYRWTAATGVNACITCGVPNAEVLNRTAVSEDGTHVYFSSANKLADAPTAADTFWPNTYVWRQGSAAIRFVARTNEVINRTAAGGYVTPDGKVLVFNSNSPSLDLVSGGNNGGFFQYYRYDSDEESVACLSCPADGVATRDVPFTLSGSAFAVMSHSRPVTDDGETFFFTAYDALVAADQNEGPDIYQWRDGEPSLITSGITQYTGFVPGVVSVSPDGQDLIFLDIARLGHEAQDDSWKVYDARVGGGFLAPPAPPSGCQEQCLPSPAPRPAALAAGSDGGVDGGNVKGVRKRCRRGQRQVRRRGKVRCVTKGTARAKSNRKADNDRGVDR